MDTSSPLRTRISLPLLKEFLLQAISRARNITRSTSLHSSHWEDWEGGLRVWREALAQIDEPGLRLLLADRDLWDAAIQASPDPTRQTASDSKDVAKWKTIPEELEKELARWNQAGLLPMDPPPSTQWPALSLMALARRHNIVWKDAQERFTQAFALSITPVCEGLLETYPGLDIQATLDENAKQFLMLGGDERPLAAVLFSSSHREVSELLREKGALKPGHIQAAQAQTPNLLHLARVDMEKARALVALGADPDVLDEDGLLADETKWFTAENSMAFHKLLQSCRTERNARIAEKRIMATAMGETPFATLSDLEFFQKATDDPIVPSEAGDMGLLSFLHHRFSHSSKGRLRNLIQILSTQRRAIRVLEAEGSLEEGLARAIGLIAREGDVDDRLDALRKAFKPLLKRVDVNQVLALALRQHGKWISDPDPLNTVLQALGDSTSNRPLLEGMGYQTWEAFRDTLPWFLEQRWSAPDKSTAQSRSRQNTWERVANAMIASLEEREDRQPLSDQEKATWLPLLMSLACGMPDNNHPTYLKVTQWMDEGVKPSWTSPEAEVKVQSWMVRRFPAFEAESTARMMKQNLAQAPTGKAPRAGRL